MPFGFLIFAVWPRAGAEMEIRFNRDVRPILSDNRYRCHSPYQNARRADLRLDVEAPVDAAKGLAARMKP